MKMKRILSLILAFGVLMTSFATIGVFAADETTDKDELFDKSVQVLSTLGIMVGKTDTDFAAEDYLTRAEMAAVAIRFLGLDANTDASTESVFSDVANDYWANYYIKMASDLGIVNGNGGGIFAPEEPVTAEQAVKIIVSALGYQPMAESEGGYPVGYRNVATRLRILDGVDFASGDAAYIKRGDIAKLVFNALDIDLMQTLVYGEDQGAEITEGATALTEYHHIDKKTGVMTADGKTGFEASSLYSGRVIVDGVAYKTNLNVSSYLGYSVEIYHTLEKMGDIEEIVVIFPLERLSDRIEVDFDDVESISVDKNFNVSAEYYVGDENKERSVSLSNPVIMYNGKSKTFATGAEAESFIRNNMKQGQLVFLENTSDPAGNTLFIENYEAYVVCDVDMVDDQFAYYTYTDKGMGRGVLELGKATQAGRVSYYDQNGASIIAGNIAINDVIMVYKSLDESIWNIYRCRDTVTGVIESKNTAKKLITINSMELKAVNTLDINIIPDYEEVTLRMDAKGKIVGYQRSEGKENYGLLMDAGIVDDAFSTTLMLRIMGTDGVTRDYKTLEKITAYNGSDVVKMTATSLITDEKLDPLTSHYLWSTNNAESFNGVKRNSWMSNSNLSDAANRRIVYFETNSKGEIHTVLVPTIPESHPECKLRIYTNFDFNTNDYWMNAMAHNVRGRTLAYTKAQIPELGWSTPVSNFAIVYEAMSMDYDEDDYKLIPGGISSLGSQNVYEGMNWASAQIYKKAKSDAVDFIIINPRYPNTSDMDVVIVESVGQTEDGYTLEGYNRGEPYSAKIKPGTRLIENIPYTRTEQKDEQGNIIYSADGAPTYIPDQVATADMLPALKAKGETLFLLTPDDEHVGKSTPYIEPGTLETGDFVRVIERDGEIVYLEMVRRAATGMTTAFSDTYTGIGYMAFLNWNAMVRGTVVDVNRDLHRVDVHGYYWGSVNQVLGLQTRTESRVVDDITLYLHTVSAPVTIYETRTGKCYQGTEYDIQVGDEIWSRSYVQSPWDIIIIR